MGARRVKYLSDDQMVAMLQRAGAAIRDGDENEIADQRAVFEEHGLAFDAFREVLETPT